MHITKNSINRWLKENYLLLSFVLSIYFLIAFIFSVIFDIQFLYSFIPLILLIILLLTYLFVGYILQDPENILPFVILTLPFERVGAISTSTLNIRICQILLGLGFIIFLLYSISKEGVGKIKIKKDLNSILLIIFFAVNVISLSVSLNRLRSFEVLIFIGYTFFGYIFITNLLRKEETYRRIILVLMITTLIICLFGLFQFAADMAGLPTSISLLRVGYTKAIFGFPRVMTTESEPQFWGNFLLVPLGISFSIIINYIIPGKSNKSFINSKYFLLVLAVFILSIINIALTFSRGAWYAGFAVLIIVLVIYLRKIITPKFIFIFMILTIVASGIFAFTLVLTNSPLDLTVLTTRALQLNDADRLLTTNDALRLFSTHSILGIGVGSFGPIEAPTIWAPPDVYGFTYGWRIVNNEYIEVLTETGIVGFVTFMAFIFVSFFIYYKTIITIETDGFTKVGLIGLLAGVTGMFIQYIGFSTLYISQIWFLLAVLNACVFNIRSRIWKI